MFKKVHKNAVLAGGLTVMLLLGGLSPVSGAFELGMGGRPIPATPYDRQVLSSGALNPFFPSDGIRSSESLFRQARAFRYVPDSAARDDWQTPEETESRWAGDCEDKAVWLFAQLKRSGHDDVRLVVGRQRAADRNLHVWVTLGSKDGYDILDPTAQKRIWRSSDFSQSQYRPLYSFDGTHRYRHDS